MMSREETSSEVERLSCDCILLCRVDNLASAKAHRSTIKIADKFDFSSDEESKFRGRF
jgi:hypothetical protein